MPSVGQISCSMCPRLAAVAVRMIAEWPSSLAVPTIPSAARRFPISEAGSTAEVPSVRVDHMLWVWLASIPDDVGGANQED